jgi:hypothetical protein
MEARACVYKSLLISNQRQLIANIRNLQSRWWRDVNRDWLMDLKCRSLAPFTAVANDVVRPSHARHLI